MVLKSEKQLCKLKSWVSVSTAIKSSPKLLQVLAKPVETKKKSYLVKEIVVTQNNFFLCFRYGSGFYSNRAYAKFSRDFFLI